jgi:hypothetical protein
MTDAEDTATSAGGEHFVSYPVAVSLIADGMKLSQPEAERALEQLGRGRHVRVRGGEYHDTRFIGGPESTPIRNSEVRRIWQRASYALDDLRREIRSANDASQTIVQPPTARDQHRAAEPGRGRPLPSWKAGIIAAAAYHLDDEGDLQQADVARFIMNEACKTGRLISDTLAKEYAAEIMREHRLWRGRK